MLALAPALTVVLEKEAGLAAAVWMHSCAFPLVVDVSGRSRERRLETEVVPSFWRGIWRELSP